ncbi:MAG TPA: hypothetical protein VHO25_14050 [Polyangiaceae bacterium]|nr:hypothetical protein [Polyangiaceae bacterium]
MASTHSLPLAPRQAFGTMRRDVWWAPQLLTFVVFSIFLVYAPWAAFQNAHYTFGNYLSPFYSPELWGSSPHALFGPKPTWFPDFIPFTPALFVMWAPAGFRFTCYYYRGAYYKAFWADPPGCAVSEPRKSYLGERSFPLIIQNIHRYFLYLALCFLPFLGYDAYHGLWVFDEQTGKEELGLAIGSLFMIANFCFLSRYTFSCHSLRHLIGGSRDEPSKNALSMKCYNCVSNLNGRHMNWAWFSLFTVILTDLYIRLCSMGVIVDYRIL